MSTRSHQSYRQSFVLLLIGACCSHGASLVAADEPFDDATSLLRQFCIDCHGNENAEAGVNLQRMLADANFAADFRQWRKVAEMVEQKKMPPVDSPQLGDADSRLISAVHGEVHKAAVAHAGDSGAVVMRRLTSAEYDYTVQDLTGLDLGLGREFVSDAVGGAGFTNVGGVQFVQDSTLQQYLAAAKQIAAHAVIGCGPLRFYQDPGQTGLELAAITRIKEIYREHGFRTAAGEGGEAFGLDRYQQAFWVAWRYLHREQLGLKDATLQILASAEEMDARFAEYIWTVLSEDAQSFPASDIVAKWRALPAPGKRGEVAEAVVRARCAQIQETLHDWHVRLGENPDAKEEARVLAENTFDVSNRQLFEMNINWPKGTKTAHVTFTVEAADDGQRPEFVVIWSNPVVQFRIPDQVLADPRPLRSFVTESIAREVRFGTHVRGGVVGADDFVTVGSKPLTIELPVLDNARSARLLVEAKLDTELGDDRIVRCSISQQEDTDQGKSVSALLANPDKPTFLPWKKGVLQFARLLPQISHREPAPSDRDPIPAPFDPTYNTPDRNHFHARIKYHRDDRFLVDNILDDATRKRLDVAWFDLLGSFEYHDTLLRFVASKYAIDLGKRRIAELAPAWIDTLPEEPQEYIKRLSTDYHATRRAFSVAAAGHLDDVIQFAEQAWRRPLVQQEQNRLRNFYGDLRKDSNLSHDQAVRAVLARVLVAPAFIYRTERLGSRSEREHAGALSNWELASRLSYFLWSSAPDAELRRAAAAGELHNADQLVRQATRMLHDAKARRLAGEFFGQWFGFYQFDRYRGADPQRFPELTDELKAAMHDEAVSFFEFIIRHDRPAREILFANYTFANRQLAAHYGLPIGLFADADHGKNDQAVYVKNVHQFHRGGLFGLGAVLTVTSAPRRTSPVKRGDWILRRVLGTPVPPPPADAGSIPADDVVADGNTVRQRLAVHRRKASCNNCHSRIDPLGFSLENYDAIGQWRDRYRDGASIETSGTFSDGVSITGVKGLKDYLKTNEASFRRTLCTKLVGYALGRRESIADVLLIEQMMADLQKDGTLSDLVETIVRSRQFQFQSANGQ